MVTQTRCAGAAWPGQPDLEGFFGDESVLAGCSAPATARSPRAHGRAGMSGQLGHAACFGNAAARRAGAGASSWSTTRRRTAGSRTPSGTRVCTRATVSGRRGRPGRTTRRPRRAPSRCGRRRWPEVGDVALDVGAGQGRVAAPESGAGHLDLVVGRLRGPGEALPRPCLGLGRGKSGDGPGVLDLRLGGGRRGEAGVGSAREVPPSVASWVSRRQRTSRSTSMPSGAVVSHPRSRSASSAVRTAARNAESCSSEAGWHDPASPPGRCAHGCARPATRPEGRLRAPTARCAGRCPRCPRSGRPPRAGRRRGRDRPRPGRSRT